MFGSSDLKSQKTRCYFEWVEINQVPSNRENFIAYVGIYFTQSGVVTAVPSSHFTPSMRCGELSLTTTIMSHEASRALKRCPFGGPPKVIGGSIICGGPIKIRIISSNASRLKRKANSSRSGKLYGSKLRTPAGQLRDKNYHDLIDNNNNDN